MTTALCRTACLRASRHTANRQVIECRDRIGLRPQPHATGLETRVTMIEMELAVEPRLHVIADRHEPHRVPLPECRGLDPRRGELAASAVEVVEAELVFEGVRAEDVVLAVGEPEDDAARGVYLP